MKAPICECLKKYCESTHVRLHMPGHGGAFSQSFLPELSALCPYDLTELPDTDDLYHASDAILESERLAAAMFGAGETLFSCGGATLAVQAAIASAIGFSGEKTALLSRSCHKSAVNALGLIDCDTAFSVSPIPSAGELANCGTYVFTSCDYYGRIADMKKISELCRKAGVITVADNSHGSHLAFFEEAHPLNCGIDIVIDSFHKTLPVYTGGAALHFSAGLCKDHPKVRKQALEYMSVFGSSSPSFLILASIDAALAFLREDSSAIFESARAVSHIKERLGGLALKNDDPLRIVLIPENPKKLYFDLYQRGIKSEFYDKNYLVMIPPFGFNEADADNLYAEICDISPKTSKPGALAEIHIPERKMSLHKAMFSEKEEIYISDASGRISGAQYALYPPGIPQITAGEVFDCEAISALSGEVSRVSVIK